MKKRKLLTREQLFRDSKKVYDVLMEESDLACVLIGASYLSELLATVLKESFIETSLADKLLGPRGIVGAFASRAELAYCLGLIDKDYYQELSRIAQIRNLFAHHHLSLTFSDESVVKVCDELQGWRWFADEWGKMPGLTIPEKTRDQFTFSVSHLDIHIQLDALDRKSKRTGQVSDHPGD